MNRKFKETLSTQSQPISISIAEDSQLSCHIFSIKLFVDNGIQKLSRSFAPRLTEAFVPSNARMPGIAMKVRVYSSRI